MAWTPDAVTEHFNGNHAEFIAKYKSDRKARIADSNSSAELQKLRSQYSILKEQAEAAIDALNASELKWKNSNQDLEIRNRELEDTCVSLQNSFISALNHLGYDDACVKYLQELSESIRKELADVIKSGGNTSDTFGEDIIAGYSNSGFINAARTGHSSIGKLIYLLHGTLISNKVTPSESECAHADLIISLILGHF